MSKNQNHSQSRMRQISIVLRVQNLVYTLSAMPKNGMDPLFRQARTRKENRHPVPNRLLTSKTFLQTQRRYHSRYHLYASCEYFERGLSNLLMTGFANHQELICQSPAKSTIARIFSISIHCNKREQQHPHFCSANFRPSKLDFRFLLFCRFHYRVYP